MKTLDKWTLEHKTVLAEHLAQGRSETDATFMMGKTFGPELHAYNRHTINNWRHSEEGKAIIGAKLAKIRSDAENRTFAHQGSRIDGLVDIAEQLFHLIGDFDNKRKESAKFVQLCGEFRQYMETIRKEMAPFQATEDAAISLFERWDAIKNKAKKKGVWDETSEN